MDRDLQPSAVVDVMHLFLFVCGVAILCAFAVDLVWTTIGTHGGGPLSRRFQTAAWACALAVHVRSGRRRHFALSLVGAPILIATIVFWTAGNWLGWLLIFSADPRAIVDVQTGRPADVSGRGFYVAYTMSTLGNGDYRPTTAGWRLATSIAAFSGLASLTLGVSFILSVLQAIVAKRTLASLLSGMGGTPEGILRTGRDGTGFGDLSDELLQLALMLHTHIEHQLAYPVLHFFHSESARTSATLRLFSLHDTLLLLSMGAAEPSRPPRLRTESLLDAYRALGHVFVEERAARHAEDNRPPAPDLNVLRRLGVATVDDETFASSVAREERTRRALYAALLNDGWTWEDAIVHAPPDR